MGGKSTTSTQSVSIPKEVLARYNAVNTRAEDVAKQPFQEYSSDPNAFVAQINPEQQSGISGINNAAGMAQPYFQQATGMVGDYLGNATTGMGQAQTDINQGLGAGQGYLGAATNYALAGGQMINPGELNTQKYLSPYLNTVLGATEQAQAQQNAQQRSALAGSAIGAGAFGGDRYGIGQANLAYQQNLSNNQTIANLMNQGYSQAQAAAMQQQGVGLGAAQANRAALMQTGQNLAALGQQGFSENLAAAQQQQALSQGLFGLGSTAANQLAGLGTGAQAAALQGAQAQIGAGTLQQQTEQAGKSALYNQFLQKQSYPFQVAQFLANIAEGTGALSGSTTTTTQPGSVFSDRRLKKDIERVGHTDDGMPIYKYKYKNDPQQATRLGLMADEVEKRKPEAVGLAGGYKTVDYDKATSEGGAVLPRHSGSGFADGGSVGPMASDPNLMALVQAGIIPYSALSHGAGPNASIPSSRPIPISGGSPARGLMTAGSLPQQQESGLSQAASTAKSLTGLYNTGKDVYDAYKEKFPGATDISKLDKADVPLPMPRPEGFASGGLVDDTKEDTPEGIYKSYKGLNIPLENPKSSLPKPGQLPQQQSGLSQVADMASAGSTIFKALSWLPFLASGGAVRPHKFGGGGLGDASAVPVDDTGVVPKEEPPKPAVVPTPENVLGVSKKAIGKMESDNRYDVLGPTVNHKNGTSDRAYGKYQVMGANIPVWTKEAFGKSMTPQEFISNPEAQEKVFEHKFGQYIKQTGNPLDAASMWFTGRPASESVNLKDVLGTTGKGYVSKFAKLSGLGAADLPESNAVPSKGGVADAQPEEDNSTISHIKNFASGLMPQTNEGKMAVLAGIFGTLASPSPFLLQAIGQGGLTGVNAYSEMTKLRNESMKNAMELVNNNFVTQDGVTWYNKMTGETLDRNQFTNTVRQIYANAGIGGAGSMSAVTGGGDSGEYKIPGGGTAVPTPKAPEAPKAPGIQTEAPAANAAPTDDRARKEPTDPTISAPVPGPTGLKDKAVPASSTAPTSELDIMSKNFNNPALWKDKPLWQNAPLLSQEADKQLSLANQYAQQAAAAGRVGNTGAETRFTTLATQARENAKMYRDGMTSVLKSASQADVDKMNEMRKLGQEFVDVQESPSAPIQKITKAQLLDPNYKGPKTTPSDWQKDLIDVQETPFDPVQKITKAQLNDPNYTGPKSMPSDAMKDKAKNIITTEAKMRDDNELRQSLIHRVDVIADILENYKTGAWDTYKEKAFKNLEAAGFSVDRKKISSIQELMKNSIGQVYDQAKKIGNKVLVAEIQGLSKTVAGENLDPDTNRNILGQTKGLLNWDQQLYRDYQDWRKGNRSNMYPEDFIDNWIREHNPNEFTKEATRSITPKGMTLPKKDELVHGQKVNSDKLGILYYNSKATKPEDEFLTKDEFDKLGQQ